MLMLKKKKEKRHQTIAKWLQSQNALQPKSGACPAGSLNRWKKCHEPLLWNISKRPWQKSSSNNNNIHNTVANSLSKQATLNQKLHINAESFMNLEVFGSSCFASIALHSTMMPTQTNALHQLVPNPFYTHWGLVKACFPVTVAYM